MKNKIISEFLNAKKNIFHSENEYIQNIRNESINMIINNHLLNEEECKDLFNNYKFNNKKFFLTDTTTEKILKNLKINGFRIIFINGIYNHKYSTYNNKYLKKLSNFFSLKSEYNKQFYDFYNKIVLKNNIFNVLNTAFIQEGIYLNIPNNIIINEPIHIIYFSYYDNNIIFNTRNLIIVGENSNVNIIEQYQSLNNNLIINNSLTEIYALSNSKIEYFKIQNDRMNSSLIDNTFFLQKKNSKCSINTFSFKGKLVKNNLNIYQEGPGISSYLRGLTIGKSKESISHNTLINHKYPLCNSYELYNNIFSGESNGIFNGKILIHKYAQKVNAFQQNNNIILSDKARIKAIPKLEIFANDVKCSHGCTIGPLNLSILFYIRSRGISEKDAQLLLLNTFFEENIKYIIIYDLKLYIINIIHELINSIID